MSSFQIRPRPHPPVKRYGIYEWHIFCLAKKCVPIVGYLLSHKRDVWFSSTFEDVQTCGFVDVSMNSDSSIFSRILTEVCSPSQAFCAG